MVRFVSNQGHVESNQELKISTMIPGADRSRAARSVPSKSLLALFPRENLTNIMKIKQISIIILAVLFVFPLMGTFAQQAAKSGSIEVITTFDYPGTGNSTEPQKINERGDIVGIFVDSNDTVGFTQGRGINNPRTVVGDYATSDGNLHGFFLSGGNFTGFDIPGAAFTAVLSINN